MLRALALVLSTLVLAACGGEPASSPEAPADTARVAALPTSQLPPDAEGALMVYSGREARLVEPFVEMFRQRTGMDVQVRYEDDAALLATLAEEGDRSPADVLWSNTTVALGTAVERNLLTILPDSMRVLPGRYVPASGLWVPITVRFRVLAYAPARVDADALATSVLSLPDVDALRGRIGWTPAYSSLLDVLTAARLQGNDEAAGDWLDAMQASGAKAYPSNAAMLSALAAGEIDVALTDQYEVLRANAGGAGFGFHTFAPGDPGNLGMVSGAGVLDTSSRQRAARRFIAFLLSTEAQAFAADSTREIPVVARVQAPTDYLSLEAAADLAPRLDVENLRDLEGTLALLREKGLR